CNCSYQVYFSAYKFSLPPQIYFTQTIAPENVGGMRFEESVSQFIVQFIVPFKWISKMAFEFHPDYEAPQHLIYRFIEPSFLYSFTMSKLSTHLLPSPYQPK